MDETFGAFLFRLRSLGSIVRLLRNAISLLFDKWLRNCVISAIVSDEYTVKGELVNPYE